MGVITPSGDMYLLNVNIDQTQANQLWFESRYQQETFFRGKVVAGLTPADYTYIQKDDVVRVNKNADQLYNCNYLMYRNTAFSNRWFYGFVTEIQWLSDHSAAISFQTDVYQTWRWDIEFRDSLIERETPPSDEIGEHLLHEELETGDFITVNSERMEGGEYIAGGDIPAGLGEMMICVSTSVRKAEKPSFLTPWVVYRDAAKGEMVGGIYSGSSILVFEANAAGKEKLGVWLKSITENGASDGIVAVYMAPKAAIMALPQTPIEIKRYDFDPTNEKVPPVAVTESYTALGYSDQSGGMTSFVKDVVMPVRPQTIEGYIPRNKKLLSPPYINLYVHNGNGAYATYDINEFKSPTPVFKIKGTVLALPEFKLLPQNYKNQDENLDEALSLKGYPMCSYPMDTYAAWVAQNGFSTALGVVGNVISAGSSVILEKSVGRTKRGAMAKAAAIGGVTVESVMAVSSITEAAQSLAKVAEMQLQPPQAAGNANTGSINSAFNKNDFYLSYKSIRLEFAKAIDMFFSMYGYKVNQVKQPSFGCRKHWYYVKMVNPNIIGAIPSTDLQLIKNIFSNGVTLWNSNMDLGRYDLYNDIV